MRGSRRLRRAVNFAIDRREISETYGWPAADHYLPPGMPGYCTQWARIIRLLRSLGAGGSDRRRHAADQDEREFQPLLLRSFS